LPKLFFGRAEVLLRLNIDYASVYKKADISGGAATPPYHNGMAKWLDWV
jgi:hypothetical protein